MDEAEGFFLLDDSVSAPPDSAQDVGGFLLEEMDGLQLEDETTHGGIGQQPVDPMEIDHFQSPPPFDVGGSGFQLDSEGSGFQFSSEEETSVEKDHCNQPCKPIFATKGRACRRYLHIENPVVSKAAVDMEILFNSCRGRRGVG